MGDTPDSNTLASTGFESQWATYLDGEGKSKTENVTLQKQVAKTGSFEDQWRVYDAKGKNETQQPVQGGASYASPEDAFKYLGNVLGQSSDETRDAGIWAGALTGQYSDEDAMAQTEPDAIRLQRDKQISDFEMVHPNISHDIVSGLMGLVPYTGQMVADSAKTGLAGAGMGAAGGAVVGGTEMAYTAPFGIGEFTVPAGVAGGAAWGFLSGGQLGIRAGVSMSAAKMASGGVYGSLLRQGVPKDMAKKAALASGVVAGLVQGLQYARVGIVLTKALNAEKPLIQKTGVQIFKQLAKEFGILLALGDAQEAANIGIDALVGKVGSHNPPTSKQIKDRMINATVKNAVAGGLALGVAHTTGKVVDTVVNHTKTVKEAMTVPANEEMVAPEEIKLIETKAKLKVAKAGDKLHAAQEKLAQIRETGEGSTKTAKLAIEVAEQELEIAQSELPPRVVAAQNRVLQAKATKTQKPEPELPKDLSPKELVRYTATEVRRANNKISELEFRAEEFKENNPGQDLPSSLEDKLREARRDARIARKQKRKADAELLNERLKEFEDAARSKFTIEKDETELQNVRRNQKMIVAVIKKNLPEELQGEFIGDVQKADTDAQLMKLLGWKNWQPGSKEPAEKGVSIRDRIQVSIEKSQKKEALDELKTQITRAKPRYKRGHKFSRFKREPVIRDMLKEFEYYYKNPDAVDAIRAEVQAKELKGENPGGPEYFMKYAIANVVGHPKEKTAKEIFDLAEAIEKLIDEGLKGTAAKLAQEQAETLHMIDELKNGIQGRDQIAITPSTEEPRKERSGIRKYLERSTTSIFSWDGLIHTATSDSVPRISDQVTQLLEISTTARDVDHGKIETAKRLMAHLEAATGLNPDGIMKTIARTTKTNMSIKYEDALGQTRYYDMDAMEGVDMLMKMEDPSLDKGTLPKQFEHNLRIALFDEDPNLLFLKNGYKNFYQDPEVWESLASAYEYDTGEELIKNPDYPGIVRRHGVKDDRLDEIFKLNVNTMSSGFKKPITATRPDQTKTRQSKLELRKQNAHIAATHWINAEQQYVHWVKRGRQLGQVVNDPEVRELLDLKYGPELHRSIVQHLKAAVNGGINEQAALVDFMNHLMRNVPTSALGAKPMMIPKHALIAQNTMILFKSGDEAKFYKGLAYYWAHKKEEDAFLDARSKALATRQHHGTRMYSGVDVTKNENLSEEDAFRRFVMWPITHGSLQYAIRPGMSAVYHYEKANGLSDEAAMDKAERVLDYQTSGTVDQLSNASRSPLIKTGLLFKQGPTKLYEEAHKATVRFIKHPSKDTARQLLKVYLLARFGVAAFDLIDAIWTEALEPKAKRREATWFRFWVKLAHGPLPFFWGEALDETAVEAHNAFTPKGEAKYEHFERTAIQFDIIQHTQSLVNDFVDVAAGKNVEWHKVALDWGGSIFGRSMGIPSDPPVKLLRKAFEGSTGKEMH